jgi:tetratricopeptide (TPR) repeat protein
MLPDTIVQRWLEVAAVGERIVSIPPKRAQAARSLLQRLKSISPEMARKELADGDSELNRQLAWLILNDALEIDSETKAEEAIRLVSWASFIAGFGDALANQNDALEAHCAFYQGVLEHRSVRLIEAYTSYLTAEIDYKKIKANEVLRGLAVYAQGKAAFDAGNMDGGRAAFKEGAREYFEQAQAIFQTGPPNLIKDEVKLAIERSFAQWELADKIVASAAPDSLLEGHRELVDAELASLLKSHAIGLAVNNQSSEKVLAAIHMAEAVAHEIGIELGLTKEMVTYFMSGHKYDAAILLLREMLAKQPDDLELLKRLAVSLLSKPDYEQAHQLLTRTVEAHPNDADLHSMLGGLYMVALKDYQKAYAHYQKALEINPGDLIAKRGFEALQQQIFAALNPAKESEDKPESTATLAQWHLDRAEAHFGAGRWDEAKDEYRQALEADPDMAQAYMGWGDVYYRTGQYHLAIAYFEESLVINPTPPVYYFLGDAYSYVGKTKRAIAAYRQALKLNPNYNPARARLEALSGGDN